MKIAYIVLCHKDPEFILHLSKTLKYKENKVFLAIDAKSAVESFKRILGFQENVIILPNKLKNYWGGWNAVKITVSALRYAINYNSYDRFIIMQGQDYPLYSNEVIEKFFEKNRTIEFCRAQNIMEGSSVMKWRGVWFKDYIDNPIINFISKLTHLINCLGIKYRNIKILRKMGVDIYSGWAHMGLTNECVKLISCINSGMLFGYGFN